MLADPKRLADVEKSFTVAAFALSPKGLAEGLTREQFEKRRSGRFRDERFRKEIASLRKKIQTLAGIQVSPHGDRWSSSKLGSTRWQTRITEVLPGPFCPGD